MPGDDVLAEDILADAADLVHRFKGAGLKLATAESCTGGLVAAAVTDVAGSSSVLDRGFVTYSNEAKIAALGVDAALITAHGAVSAEVAVAMAEGALTHSLAQVAVSITGIAGPGGATATKPVGLVHLAVARSGRPTVQEACLFGDIGRRQVRQAAVRQAFAMLRRALA
jgi:nicotinamide-nucleotide amidase